MNETAHGLFHADRDGVSRSVKHGTGILPVQTIRALIRDKEIISTNTLRSSQMQPASVDLRLGDVGYRIRASFLPGPGNTVTDKLDELVMHEFSLADGAVLETGCVYLVPLQESLNLSDKISAAANPKSSTGRLDVFTRLITDNAIKFDQVAAGYSGPLYAEISPQTFSILVRPGSTLSQIRFRRGSTTYSDSWLHRVHEEYQLVDREPHIDHGLGISVDLMGRGEYGLVGYRAKRHAGLIDIDRPHAYQALDFWDPVYAFGRGRIILDPDEFYILASKEAVHVPPEFAAEMLPYDPLVGEFRVHYAGFFDPGFGHSAAGGGGAKAVLEVRSREVPFVLGDGQIVARLMYERLTDRPDRVYGMDIGSHYQRQGLALSKHFIV